MKTLADVAAEVGVSQATVSRVLNGKPGVSDDTRQAVLNTAKSMGITSTVGRNQPRHVAVVTPNLANPVFASLLTAISTQLTARNILPFLCTYTSGGTSEETLLSMVLSEQIDGAIFLSGQYDSKGNDYSIYQRLAEHRIPMVFINAGDPDLPGYFIRTDDRLATEMALQHLVNQGHTRIGLLLGNPNHYPSITKYNSALDFANRTGLDLKPEYVEWAPYGLGTAQAATARLTDAGVSAIICASDELALSAFKSLTLQGLQVPDDISIVGYDDSSYLGYISPGLTTIRQPVDALSSGAVSALASLIESPQNAKEHVELLFDPELVVRGTTAICKDLLPSAL